MTGNGTYKVTEAASMPSKRTRHRAFIADVLLRLEQTPLPRALKVEFESPDSAGKARAALAHYCRKHWGANYLDLRVLGECLYVQRGERWVKPD